MAQNVYKNKNLQGEFSDPDSPYYLGESGTDENGQPIGNCNEINGGCTASQEEIEDYIGDEIIVIGSSSESLYYYHPDHLGSASVITDGSGNLREHIEYFAFGETWVQEGASKKTPFMYTGKELDQETGLYYYGARYYDPRTSVWQSVDPILEKYLPSGDPEKDKNLPGLGGVFNPANLAGYTYTHQNPVRYVDPDGNEVTLDPYIKAGGSFTFRLGINEHFEFEASYDSGSVSYHRDGEAKLSQSFKAHVSIFGFNIGKNKFRSKPATSEFRERLASAMKSAVGDGSRKQGVASGLIAVELNVSDQTTTLSVTLETVLNFV